MNKDYKVGNIVSVSLIEFHNSINEESRENSNIILKKTTYSIIKRTLPECEEDDGYYDMQGQISTYACCDGEECKIISIEGDRIKLLSLDSNYDNDFFYLSKNELETADFYQGDKI